MAGVVRFSWTIENVRFYINNENDFQNDYLMSEKFAQNDNKIEYNLEMHPTYEKNKYFAIFANANVIEQKNEGNSENGFSKDCFRLLFKISILNKLGSNFTKVQTINLYESRKFGWKKFVHWHDLESYNGLEDKLTLQCEIRVIETELELENFGWNESSKKLKKYYTEKNSNNTLNKWTIEKYSYHLKKNDNYVLSEDMVLDTVTPIKFHLRLYPNGKVSNKREYATLNVWLNQPIDDNLTLQFRVSILDTVGNKHNTKVCTILDTSFYALHGWNKYISNKDLTKFGSNLLPDDKLTLHIETVTLMKVFVGTVFSYYKSTKQTNGINGQLTYLETDDFTENEPFHALVAKHDHKWTLNNFCAYFDRLPDTMKRIESNCFNLINDENIKVKPILSLTEKSEDESLTKRSFISIYLEIFSVYVGELTVQFRISLLDENQEKINSRELLRKYDSIENKHGIDDFIESKLLMDKSNKYLPNGKLTILMELFLYGQQEFFDGIEKKLIIDNFVSEWKCRQIFDVTLNSETMTDLKMFIASQKWEIGGFVKLESPNPYRPYFIDFSEFYPNGYYNVEIFLRIYPNEKEKESENITKLCLFFKSSEKMRVTVSFQISLLDIFGTKKHTQIGIARLSKSDNIELEFKLIRNDILKKENNLLIGNSLLIIFEGAVLLDPMSEDVEISEICIRTELNNLLETNKKTDMILNFLNGKQLHCHKSVLVACSEVLEAMFKHDYIENLVNQVEFFDEEFDVFYELLRYFYTGKILGLSSVASDLFIVADKYCLYGLKSFIERWLCSNQTVDTAIEMYNLGVIYNSKELKKAALKYYRKNANLIINTKSYQTLKETRLDLLKNIDNDNDDDDDDVDKLSALNMLNFSVL